MSLAAERRANYIKRGEGGGRGKEKEEIVETHCAAASDYKPTLKCSGVLVDAVQIWSNGAT